ncbi:MAG TPA: nodulation protein NfeD, partial [Thermodesulfobacteriota bacterium]|nr:nodulation protein NfeD [Thermodesulfobacteriota bacterium]
MTLSVRRMLIATLALLLFVPGVAPSAGAVGKEVLVATIAAPIGPVTADYLSAVIARAEEDDAVLLVVELDTPGGLDSAMREMVQSILKSRVPVAVYVSPQGARAASAGVLITLAADVAAMAPGTNIGAAHPVNMGGGAMDNTMSRKVENDAAAYARSLAESHGRNGDWAESAVRESASLSEKNAVEKKVVDLVASSLPDLLARIDGREIRKGDRTMILRTKGAPVVRVPMGLRHRVLSALAN